MSMLRSQSDVCVPRRSPATAGCTRTKVEVGDGVNSEPATVLLRLWLAKRV